MEHEKTNALVVHESEAMEKSTQLIQLAVEKGASVEALEKLLALQLRWEASEQRKAFVAAVARFGAIGVRVLHNKTVKTVHAGKGPSFTYSSLPAIVDAVTEPLAQCGLSKTWKTSQTDKLITVTCTISHAAGHSESVSLSAPPDAGPGRNAIQAVGSTVTYLSRYTLLAALGLATEEERGERKPAEQQETPEELVDRVTAKAQTAVDQRLQPATEQQIARLKSLAGSADVSEAKREAIVKALEDKGLTQGRAGALIGAGKRDETGDRPQPPPPEEG